MEAFKNAMAVFAGIIGTLTGLVTLYAKYLDVKKSAAREADPAPVPTLPPARPTSNFVDDWPEEPVLPARVDFPPRRDASAVERARQAVKAPAIALMVAGGISLFFNLFVAAFGYVDRYVTPLTTDSQNRQAYLAVAGRGEFPIAPGMVGSPYGTPPEDPNVVLTIFTLLSLSVAGAAAIWAGYGMLRLRSYWLSVAGSIAIMPATGVCCLSGIPIGVWSLVVLFRPEVASSFR